MVDLVSSSGFSLTKALPVLAAVAVLAALDVIGRRRGSVPTRYAFGAMLGTALASGAFFAADALLDPARVMSGYLMALGVVTLVVVWRLLFGTWDSGTKATVLGTFLFWIVLRILLREEGAQRAAHLIAIAVALVPAVVWCAVFLPYHKERLSVVFSLFFAGILSTVPILFYDALMRRGTALHFFLFRVELQSFSRSAHSFVADAWPALTPVALSLASMFVAFLCVGLIEEASKMWVLKRAGRQYITSIDDMMQMAILVAIGFAFAENITPSGYFVTFVREYLMDPNKRDWLAFVGNVAGRSVLTSMVHIVSTGVAGYFLGLAAFADPCLKEARARGCRQRMLGYLHDVLGMRKKEIFRREMIAVGLVLATLLHTVSNFLVSIPDTLPGNPRTIGDLLGSPPGSPLHLVALLLLPTLLYVVGGFFLLTWLFQRKENMKERGHLIVDDLVVPDEGAA